LSEEPNKKPARRPSSAYVRVVDGHRVEVINTKQRNDGPRGNHKKWIVVDFNGNRKTLVGQADKKYDAIDILLAHEIDLKAQRDKKEENDK
jgi:hypothetical protein